MPRSSNERLTEVVFRAILAIFRFRMRKVDTYEARDQMMAMYAPLALLMLPLIWVTVILIGYMFVFWSVEPRSLYDVFSLSGSSLFTLGFTKVEGVPVLILQFSESAFGLMMIALLIAYLPTIYSAAEAALGEDIVEGRGFLADQVREHLPLVLARKIGARGRSCQVELRVVSSEFTQGSNTVTANV